MTVKKKLNIFYWTCFVGALLYIILVYTLHLNFISGSSMSPTYHDGQIVLGEAKPKEADGWLMRGDVVVFKAGPFRKFIKRVIALPGEEVSIIDGRVYINGILYDEQFPMIEDAGILSDGPIVLKQDEYFCLGDNRNHSNDSRALGPIHINKITQKIVKTII